MGEIDHKYKMIMMNLPVGMGQTIYNHLLEHVGKENAILGRELAAQVYQFYKKEPVADFQRKMRDVIAELRKSGYLICSAPGATGGYWLPKNRKEFDEFIADEFESKIVDMSITKNTLISAADRQLGQVYQESIFNV